MTYVIIYFSTITIVSQPDEFITFLSFFVKALTFVGKEGCWCKKCTNSREENKEDTV